MDKIIHTAAKKYDARLLIDLGQASDKLYFFFRQELTYPGPTPELPVRRHAIPNKGRIYDYIEDKYYNTLADWAQANGRSTSDILYGANRMYFKESITLDALLRYLNPAWRGDPQVPTPDMVRREQMELALGYIQQAAAVLSRMY